MYHFEWARTISEISSWMKKRGSHLPEYVRAKEDMRNWMHRTRYLIDVAVLELGKLATQQAEAARGFAR